MANFSAQEYKQKLKASARIGDCEKVPVPNIKQDQNFIFISYSHSDYKKVYQDLADLRESGIPFWYDKGLPAGESWLKSVRRKLGDPRCAGAIFYLSGNLFSSRSVQAEIDIICGRDSDPEAPDHRLKFFSVNLTDRSPHEILLEVSQEMSFGDTVNPMDRIRSWTDCLADAFGDDITYLPFSGCTHKMDLIEQIGICFNIHSKQNPYDFGGARFIRGNAAIEFDNGSRYDGEFRDGLFHGIGTMEYTDNSMYNGQWQEGVFHGTGVMEYADGAIYSGDWVKGQRHGTGTYHWAGGTEYHGQWENDRRNGNGTLRWPGGATFTGEWKNGKRDGTGDFCWPDGKRYSGQWKNSRRHGQGTMLWPDGREYTGLWKSGKRCGQGTMYCPGYGTFEGEWKDDKGQGTFTGQDGCRYEGSWDKLRFKGQGTYYEPDGTARGGIWDGGRLVRGRGVLRYPDGSSYDGEIRGGQRHGYGRYTLTDGTVLCGTFKNDEFTGS